jgi:hypothetical protein
MAISLLVLLVPIALLFAFYQGFLGGGVVGEPGGVSAGWPSGGVESAGTRSAVSTPLSWQPSGWPDPGHHDPTTALG